MGGGAGSGVAGGATIETVTESHSGADDSTLFDNDQEVLVSGKFDGGFLGKLQKQHENLFIQTRSSLNFGGHPGGSDHWGRSGSVGS